MGGHRDSGNGGAPPIVELEPLALVVDAPAQPLARDVWQAHHERLILLAAQRVGDHATAQALVRDVFAKALPRWDQLVDPVGTIEQRVRQTSDDAQWSAGGDLNSFRNVEHEAHVRSLSRRKLIGAAIGLVCVTALVTNVALGGSGNASRAASTSSTSTRSSTTSTRSDPGVVQLTAVPVPLSTIDPNVVAPSLIPGGFRLVNAERFPQIIPTISPVTGPTQLLAASASRVISVSADATGRSGIGEDVGGDGHAVRIGDNTGFFSPRSDLSAYVSWRDRRNGIDFVVGVIGMSADEAIGAAADIRAAREANGAANITLGPSFGDWLVVPQVAARPNPRWVLTYERGTASHINNVVVNGLSRLTDLQIVATYAFQFGAAPTVVERGGRREFWFVPVASSSVSPFGVKSTIGVIWQEGDQTIVVAADLSRADTEQLIDSMHEVANAAFVALRKSVVASAASPNVGTQQTQRLVLNAQPGGPGASVDMYGLDPMRFACVQFGVSSANGPVVNTSRFQECGALGDPVVVFGELQGVDGHVRIGGMVTDKVATIRALPEGASSISIPFVTDAGTPTDRHLFYADLPAKYDSAAVEFFDSSGTVVDRRVPLYTPLHVEDVVAIGESATVVAHVGSVVVLSQPTHYLDGTSSECLTLQVESGFALTPIGVLNCGSVPVDLTVATTQNVTKVVGVNAYAVVLVPSGAVSAEIVFAFSPTQDLPLIATPLHHVVVAQIPTKSELPIAIRFRAGDGSIIETVGYIPTIAGFAASSAR